MYMDDKKKVFIIDDDQNQVREIKDKLEQVGYIVYFACDGETSFKKIEEAKPDIILLDLVLPDKSGFRIAQTIREMPEYALIPIIAISLKREDIDKHIAAKCGITEYIEKPIDYAKLLFKIKDIVNK